MKSLILHTLRSIVAAFLFLNFIQEAYLGIRNNSNDRYPALDIPITKSQLNQRLLLCPANTEIEKEINEGLSVSRNCLFTADRITDSFNIKLSNICHNPIKPVIIYNLDDKQYEVGYELYIEERIIEPKSSLKQNYNSYVPINENNVLDNSTNSAQVKYFRSPVKYEDGNWTIIEMEAEPYRPRIFHWKCELHFKYHKYDKTTQRLISIEDVEDDDLKYKCSDDILEDSILQIYSAQNQETCLMDIEIPALSPGTQNQIERSHQQIQNRNQTLREQSFGHLVKSQIIPSWYFHTSWSKLASCTRMNIVPIWKIIADGQLKKVDLYLLAAEYQLRKNENYHIAATIFGVSGVLNVPNKNNPNTRRDRFLWDFESRYSQKIPIPKIIYRIFSLASIGCGRYSVAIIIHNVLANVPNTERICDHESRPTGWGRIENNDSSIGLTYTCPLTRDVLTKLGVIEGAIMSSPEEFLRLDGIPNRPRELLVSSVSWLNKEWSVDWSEYLLKSSELSVSPATTSIPLENRDETSRINTEFERLLQLV